MSKSRHGPARAVPIAILRKQAGPLEDAFAALSRARELSDVAKGLFKAPDEERVAAHSEAAEAAKGAFIMLKPISEADPFLYELLHLPISDAEALCITGYAAAAERSLYTVNKDGSVSFINAAESFIRQYGVGHPKDGIGATKAVATAIKTLAQTTSAVNIFIPGGITEPTTTKQPKSSKSKQGKK